ncbi:hypothetical protein OENI_70110 [Oenococcus oeni]|nr:hypothetical protein OENI_70110 [Oenococcus oeni]
MVMEILSRNYFKTRIRLDQRFFMLIISHNLVIYLPKYLRRMKLTDLDKNWRNYIGCT